MTAKMRPVPVFFRGKSRPRPRLPLALLRVLPDLKRHITAPHAIMFSDSRAKLEKLARVLWDCEIVGDDVIDREKGAVVARVVPSNTIQIPEEL